MTKARSVHADSTHPLVPETWADTASAGRRGVACRLAGALAAAASLAVVAGAGWLTPRTDGFGTHRQLGLPYCSSLARTGWPCPTCGVTTSVAAAARGRLAAAWGAQPFGVVLVAGVLAVGAAGGAQLATGRPVLARVRPRLWWAAALVGAMLGGWVWTLVAGALSGRWPLR